MKTITIVNNKLIKETSTPRSCKVGEVTMTYVKRIIRENEKNK